MNILSVDTTSEVLSVALRADSEVFAAARRFKAPHDETLLPAVGRLLKKAGLALGDLDAVAAASGPGRFTGIRIGMAYASVAAARLKVPAVAVSRFSAAAFHAPAGKVCAVLEGFRGEKYYQLFEGRAPVEPPRWIGGEAWAAARRGFEKAGIAILEGEPGAQDLLAPALSLLAGKKSALPPFEPLYLKPAGYMLKR